MFYFKKNCKITFSLNSYIIIKDNGDAMEMLLTNDELDDIKNHLDMKPFLNKFNYKVLPKSEMVNFFKEF